MNKIKDLVQGRALKNLETTTEWYTALKTKGWAAAAKDEHTSM